MRYTCHCAGKAMVEWSSNSEVSARVPCTAMRAIAFCRISPGPWSTGAHMTRTASAHTRQVVALFNASDDTLDMVQRMLDASGFSCLVGCHFSDLKKGDAEPVKTLRDTEGTVIRVAPAMMRGS